MLGLNGMVAPSPLYSLGKVGSTPVRGHVNHVEQRIRNFRTPGVSDLLRKRFAHRCGVNSIKVFLRDKGKQLSDRESDADSANSCAKATTMNFQNQKSLR